MRLIRSQLISYSFSPHGSLEEMMLLAKGGSVRKMWKDPCSVNPIGAHDILESRMKMNRQHCDFFLFFPYKRKVKPITPTFALRTVPSHLPISVILERDTDWI